MIIVQDFQEVPTEYQNTTLIIGNFDSVHKGHQYLISKAKEIAKNSNSKLALLSFDPHPCKFFKPESPNINILAPSTKENLLKKNGIEIFFIQQFDKNFSSISAEDFISEFLVGRLAIKNLVVGTNFNFGYKKTGNTALLSESALKYNFSFFPIELLKSQDKKISSSSIRKYLSDGEIKLASEMLGYNYSIEGTVLEGDKRGRKIGFPTANLDIQGILHPKNGVYSAHVELDGQEQSFKAIVNIGTRPTFDNKHLAEAHIFDFNQDIYGKKLKIYLNKYIRPQIKFNNLNELKIQIKLDVQKAKEFLNK